jgi:hypothetical protein
MNQPISYKDILMKNSDKEFEAPKKTYTPHLTIKEIKKVCTTGDINKLKLIPKNYFLEDKKEFYLKLMNDKINEIELWKYEDQNQSLDILEEFDNRISGINLCIEYLNTL